jgi:hypothetical protein
MQKEGFKTNITETQNSDVKWKLQENITEILAYATVAHDHLTACKPQCVADKD